MKSFAAIPRVLCWSGSCAQWKGNGQAISADKADSQFLHLLLYRSAWNDQCGH